MNKKLLLALSMILILALSTPGALAQDLGTSIPESGDLPEHVPGEILIGFNPGVNSAQAEAKLTELGLQSKRRIPSLQVHLVKLPPGLSVEKAIGRFSHLPGVEYAEPNYILQLAADPPVEVTGQWELVKIQAQDAWNDSSLADQNIVLLATVDTGIDKSHTDLADNVWKNPGETGIDGTGNDKETNSVDDDGNGYIDDWWGWDFVNNDNDPYDDNLHGTAVSSVMAGVKDNAGVAGVCHWCQVMAVKVMSGSGTGTLDAVASGIIYATDQGAKGINLSLVGATGTATLEYAVNYAWDLGALVVAGAGNNGENAFMYPAGYANAMAIASTDKEDRHSCFSNYADGYISVSAPGEEIVVAMPDQSYGVGSGTSLSTPLVTGLGGLLFSQDPQNRTNSEVRALIENTAEDLSPPGVDAAFGYGRINALRAVKGITSQLPIPDGRFSTNNTASGYAHARKLVRDSSGTLHLIWHTQEGSLYKIRYATKTSDDGATWIVQEEDVFNSNLESYHPALATDNQYLYVAIPSRSVSDYYQILFTRKPINGGEWSTPQPLMGGTDYHAVRPDLYVDPSNGRLHLVASSFDDAPYVYYLASGDKGISWDGQVAQVNPSTGTVGANSNTRYASVYANGDNIYIVSRTVSGYLLVTYYMHTVRSTDGGQTWFDQTKISSFLAIISGEYGISIAGVGDRLYMGYEVGSNLYFRYHNGTAWSGYETLELGDANNVNKWPSITQAEDGQAWMLFEVNGEMFMRHYDGTTWEAKESIGPGNYANLKLGTNGNQVEWIYTSCNGAPFMVEHESRTLGANNPPTANFTHSIVDLTATFTDSSTDSDGTIANWDWDFGDGDNSTLQNPSHSYASAGTYTVSLTVTDNDGAADSVNQSVTVTEPPNVPPTASFTQITAYLTATFTDTSTDSDGTIASWLWNFGDDNSSTAQNPVHSYAAAGTYTVSLTVTDDDGAENSVSQNVSITEPPNAPPAASFSYSTDNLTATFNDTSTDSDGTIASWLWNFEDDNSSTAQNPVHSYAAAGTYTVSLTVTDDDGAENSVSQNVTVSEAPIPSHEYIQVVNGEITVSGTISGNYLDTQIDDGFAQTITEVHSGGKPNQRISFLEHIWNIDVHPGEIVTFSANAWTPVSSDGDAFQFQYSLDDSTYTNMFTISNNSDSGVYQFFTLPTNASGKVYIRFIDTDRNPGNRTLDTAYIDHLFISSQTAEGYLPAEPHDLTAIPVSSNQINLSWIDNTNDALGYQVERSRDGSNWQVIGNVIADITSFNDIGLETDSTYIYRVRAYNATGYSVYSNTDSATTNQATTMHIGDLDGSSLLGNKNRWEATVTVKVHDANDQAVQGATVLGNWDNGNTGTCSTDSSSLCPITLLNIKGNISSVTFDVTSISKSGWEYDSSQNFDPDGDSDGTSITISH